MGIDSGQRHRLERAHSERQHVQHALGDRPDRPTPAGTRNRQPQAPVWPADDGGTGGAPARPAGLDRVAPARVDAETGHRVVVEETETSSHDARSAVADEGVIHRDHEALLVGHNDARRVALSDDAGNVRGCAGCSTTRGSAASRLGQHRNNRHLDERRVGQISRALHRGELEGSHELANVAQAEGSFSAVEDPVEQREDLEQRHSRLGWWRRVDRPGAELPDNRLRHCRPARGKVFGGDQAPVAGHVPGNPVGNRSLVEGRRTA